jgi:hypothetical protein
MDGLDLLKKDWKKREASLPHLSYDQIYQMLWKRSSSIVKWIFVISIVEFLFWALLSVIFSDKHQWELLEEYNMTTEVIIISVLSYLITFYFIYCFYRNYRKISSTDNAKLLMKNILKTRKTVKRYIAFIIISNILVVLLTTYEFISYHASNSEITEPENYSFNLKNWLFMFAIIFAGLLILSGLLLLFYRVVYGILLRRLNRNYKELKKLEI